MSRARVAVLKVITHELSVTAAAAEYGYSRQHLHRLLSRYRQGGLDAVDPRPRTPKSNPNAVTEEVRQFLLAKRKELVTAGFDAGPVTLAWHLEHAGHPKHSTSTIRRVLHAAGLITAEPRKRPRSSYRTFQAAQPNQCWQSDVTHWQLADGIEVEILNWLDDHSRYLLACTVFDRVTGDDVSTNFLTAIDQHGPPATTLTDNGSIYTSRFTGGKNAFEYLLATLGIEQKNGHPNHPQTQGKIERFHQTLKRWLTQQPPAATRAQLQDQLDWFRTLYNEQRPHRSLNRTTPGHTYRALPKAAPTGPAAPGHYRLRYDHVDRLGKMSFRRAGRMHHLGIGIRHARKRVLAVADDTTVTVIHLDTGEIISEHTINPDRTYWRNQQTSPGRWPGR